jgi:hypothetical protein
VFGPDGSKLYETRKAAWVQIDGDRAWLIDKNTVVKIGPDGSPEKFKVRSGARQVVPRPGGSFLVAFDDKSPCLELHDEKGKKQREVRLPSGSTLQQLHLSQDGKRLLAVADLSKGAALFAIDLAGEEALLAGGAHHTEHPEPMAKLKDSECLPFPLQDGTVLLATTGKVEHLSSTGRRQSTRSSLSEAREALGTRFALDAKRVVFGSRDALADTGAYLKEAAHQFDLAGGSEYASSVGSLPLTGDHCLNFVQHLPGESVGPQGKAELVPEQEYLYPDGSAKLELSTEFGAQCFAFTDLTSSNHKVLGMGQDGKCVTAILPVRQGAEHYVAVGTTSGKVFWTALGESSLPFAPGWVDPYCFDLGSPVVSLTQTQDGRIQAHGENGSELVLDPRLEAAVVLAAPEPSEPAATPAIAEQSDRVVVGSVFLKRRRPPAPE